ncbi:PBECR4 domain-containing protein [Thomasclavelia sp.]|uniref:PBECR4 domain-containing protein n=1 Tax=Thomasclavelia sp. TaxID=3025757 RepID=UPI0025FB86DD|nr:PBECR4 domain-containing protein [Thomasclavelia sp.]
MTLREKKIKIINNINQAAQLYKQYLLGKTFMYVFDDRYIEVSFRKKDFAHLCGVEKTISSKSFYNDAIKGKLRHNQIYFSARHPMSLSIKKTNKIKNINKCISEEGFILENIKTKTTVFKFGFTELEFTLCFDYDLDEDGNKKSNYLIVKSLRDEDCFKKTTNAHEIDFVFQKNNDEKIYNIITYKNVNKDMNQLCPEIKALISVELINNK